MWFVYSGCTLSLEGFLHSEGLVSEPPRLGPYFAELGEPPVFVYFLVLSFIIFWLFVGFG